MSLHFGSLQVGSLGRAVAPFLSDSFVESTTDLSPDITLLQAAEVIVNTRPGRKVGWQHAPLAARLGDIKNGIDNLPSGILGYSAAWIRASNEVFNALPLGISQVGWIHLVVILSSVNYATILRLYVKSCGLRRDLVTSVG